MFDQVPLPEQYEDWRRWAGHLVFALQTELDPRKTLGQADGLTSLNGGPIGGLRNAIINGDLNVWQRGTSFVNPASNSLTADRMRMHSTGSGASRTISRQNFSPFTGLIIPQEPLFYLRWDETVAGTGETEKWIDIIMEDVRTFAGQTATFSFWARSLTGSPIVDINLAQVFGSGGSSAVFLTPVPFTLTSTWTRYQASFAVPSITGKTVNSADSRLAVTVGMPLNSTFQVDVAQMQLEAGAFATVFEQRPLGLELSLCERYFEKSYSLGNAPGTATFVSSLGFTRAKTAHLEPVMFRTRKRAAPTITLYNANSGATGTFRDFIGAADIAVTPANQGNSYMQVLVTGGGTVGNDLYGHYTLDAEL